MDIKYKILNFDKYNLSILVNYFSDDLPQGLTYQLDLPGGKNFTKDELDKYVLMHAPLSQMERMLGVGKNIFDVSFFESLISLESQKVDNLQLEILHAKRKFEIKLEKVLDIGVEFLGHRFSAKREVLALLTANVVQSNMSDDKDKKYKWRSYINLEVELSKEQLIKLHQIMVDYHNEAISEFYNKIDELEQVSTVEEIKKINWYVLGDVRE